MLPKRVYAKVSLDNIKKNIEEVRKRLPEATEIMGIVKANSYGHGSIAVSQFLQEIGVSYFGVASVDEAVELRNNGITKSILVLGELFKENALRAVENDIECTVANLETAENLSNVAKSIGKTARIHIKIDTGMGRIGFQTTDDDFAEVKRIFALENIQVVAMFTHFARADYADKSSANAQKEKFLRFTDALINEGHSFKRHMYNSAASMEMDGYSGEIVRCGIMMYGLYPSEEMDKSFKLLPAMELKSSISFIKDVDTGFSVSYGSTFVTDKPMKIATVPVGYADGYPRYLSNKGQVIVNGVRCKILGKICMDQFMIDVSEVPNVKVGDEITLIGVDGNEVITVEDLSDNEYRFNYEFCCLINKRVPRIYVKNGRIIE